MARKDYKSEEFTASLVDILKLYYRITYQLDEIKPSVFKRFLKGSDEPEIEQYITSLQQEVLTLVNSNRKKRLTLKTGVRYTKPSLDDFIEDIMEDLGYER